jgi:hypothetical protein
MKHSLRIKFTSVAAVLATVALTASAVAAIDAFLKFDATGPNADGSLTTDFKIAGLGRNVTITLTASANATAVYACQNNSGNFPADPKKQVLAGPVGVSGGMGSGKNGSITGSLTISPPATTLDCPGGQHPVLAFVSYEDVAISSSTGATESLSLNFTEVYWDLKANTPG